MKFARALPALIWATVFLLKAAGADAAEAIDLRAVNEKVAAQLVAVMGGCPERAWPGYSWKDLNVVLVDGQDRPQIAINGADMSLSDFPASQLPPGAVSTVYNFFKIGEQRWMWMNAQVLARVFRSSTAESLTEQMFATAVHEGFHHVGQAGWTGKAGRDRGTEVPIRWEPRYQRRMLLGRMGQALTETGGSGKFLGQAATWFRQWSSGSPREVHNTTDGYEGSARYVETVAKALLERGCAVPETELQADVGRELTPVFYGPSFALDKEGYDTGGLAALLLRRLNVPGWEARVAKSETPVEILLENRAPVDDDGDVAVRARYAEEAVPVQAEAVALTGETLRLLAAQDSVMVNLPREWRPGSFSPIDFYIDAATGANLTPIAHAMDFVSADGRLQFHADPRAVTMSQDGNPCKEPGWQYVIAPDDLTIRDEGQVQIENKQLRGLVQARLKAVIDGRRWVCAGE